MHKNNKLTDVVVVLLKFGVLYKFKVFSLIRLNKSYFLMNLKKFFNY